MANRVFPLKTCAVCGREGKLKFVTLYNYTVCDKCSYGQTAYRVLVLGGPVPVVPVGLLWPDGFEVRFDELLRDLKRRQMTLRTLYYHIRGKWKRDFSKAYCLLEEVR